MSEQKPHKNTIKVQIRHFYLGMGVEEEISIASWLIQFTAMAHPHPCAQSSPHKTRDLQVLSDLPMQPRVKQL